MNQARLGFQLSEETIKRLREVVTYIKERNRAVRFDMLNWFRRIPHESGIINERCQTACCFAGFAAEKEGLAPVFAGPESILASVVITKTGACPAIIEWARRYFGLGLEEGSQIFNPYKWPSPFFERYSNARTNPVERVKVLEDRIEHFISTGW